MNLDPWEKELQDRVEESKLLLRDPTPGWKQDILGNAALARDRQYRAPRWLLLTLGAAWGLILVLHLTTPKLDAAPFTGVAHSTPLSPSHPPPGPTSWSALTAFNLYLEPVDYP